MSKNNLTSIDETNIKNMILESNNDKNRDTLDLHNKVTDLKSNVFGTTIYIVVVVILIPLLLIHYKMYNILIPYFPNVDMIATSLGYNGGPSIYVFRNIWLYLYNPNNSTFLVILINQ